MKSLIVRYNGFTIVELVVVIAMFGMAAATLTSLFSYMQYSQREVQYLSTATRAARSQIEILRNGQYASLDPATPIIFTSSLPASLPSGSTGRVDVTMPAGMSGLKKADVTVSWPVGSMTKSTTLTTLIGASGLTE
ncbi:MAG: type II secretion system protein [Chloroflexi bacterium]|nr:MAG: type II secretion system protein [Chloroflexota bacterium]